MQRLQRERRVAQPRVAVVPVALAAGRLGQRRRERRHRRAGRHVREALDRQRRALDRKPPAVVGHARAGQPRPPELRRLLDLPERVGGVGRQQEPFAPGERAVQRLALGEQMPRAGAVALQPQRHVRSETDRLTRAARVGDVAVVADERPVGGRAAVVEDGLADELDLHAPVDARDGAHEHVLGVVVGGRARVRRDRVLARARADHERVVHDDPAARGVPGGLEQVRAGRVAAARRDVDAERGQAEVARLAVEQRAEHARCVEARHAQPADAPVGRDERAGVAVGDEAVVGDRRERGRGGGALRGLGGARRGDRAGAGRRVGGAHDATHGPCQRPEPATSASAAAGPHVPFA